MSSTLCIKSVLSNLHQHTPSADQNPLGRNGAVLHQYLQGTEALVWSLSNAAPVNSSRARPWDWPQKICWAGFRGQVKEASHNTTILTGVDNSCFCLTVQVITSTKRAASRFGALHLCPLNSFWIRFGWRNRAVHLNLSQYLEIEMASFCHSIWAFLTIVV